MKVLDGRQQETLSRLCIKLREGDAVKFLKELMLLRGEHQEDCPATASPPFVLFIFRHERRRLTLDTRSLVHFDPQMTQFDFWKAVSPFMF